MSVFPKTVTPLSAPIAQGGFTLMVPSVPVPRRHVLPLRPANVVNYEADERTILEYLSASNEWGRRAPQPEEILKVILTSNWTPGMEEWVGTGYSQQKRVVNRARDFLAVIRRRRAKGWDVDAITVFKLTIYGARDLNGNPPNRIPPIGAITVGSQINALSTAYGAALR